MAMSRRAPNILSCGQRRSTDNDARLVRPILRGRDAARTRQLRRGALR